MRLPCVTICLLSGIFLACSAVNGEQGFGDDADPLAVAKIWKANEIPEDYKDANRRFQGIPSVETTADGRVWATWFTGGNGEDHDNYVLLITSEDHGETWSAPLFAIDPQDTTRAYDPSLWCDPLGRLWIFWAQGNISARDANNVHLKGPDGDKIRDCRAGTWCMISENPDAGTAATWSEPRRIADGLMLNKPMVDSRGQWLFPISVWRYHSRYPVAEELVIGPNVFVTTDEGKTFSLLGHSKLERSKSRFDEHNIVELSDGRLWILARTLAGCGEAYSEDGGKTWTDVKPSPVIKQTSSRFYAQRLQSGNIMIVKNGPVGEDVGRNTIMASLSEDDGKTWTEPLVLDERPNVTYPNGTQAKDGTIYVVWDRGRVQEKEILMARFTEDDLKQSKLVSPESKTKILINKAQGGK
ncbi:MAG: sialidase family protein [Planctomycetia bacterium]|nr:sialidase family protein [Planctomycetia bacterium]